MPRRFPSRSRLEWAKIASHRIVSVLRKHRLCYVRQLESKISEAGPLNLRAQPLSIKDGLAYLLDRGTVKVALPKGSADGITIDFFALEDFSASRYNDTGRLDFILEYWPIYREGTSDKTLCGNVLEALVDKALAQSSSIIRVGQPDTTFSNIYIDGRRFDNSPPIDHVAYLRDLNIVAGIEDKNWREWIYPRDAIIERLLLKCIRNGHVPVLVARKLPYITRLMFGKLGILGFETHFMYLHPSLEEKFELIRHKDGIGFADIRFAADPPKHLCHSLHTILPKQLASTAATFEANRKLIERFLGEEITYYELMSELGIFPEIEDVDEASLEYQDDYFEPY